jgi:DNA-binding Xre family transcriptional regulator
MSKGEAISMSIVAKICTYFKCDVGDVMEIMPDMDINQEEEKHA